jgi:hypothetical protein
MKMNRGPATKSIFERIEETTVIQRDPRLTLGSYVLEVIELRHTPNGFNGESFLFRFLVKEASSNDKEINPSPVGSVVGYAFNVTRNPFCVNDITACLQAIVKQKVNNARQCFDSSQPCKGALVRANVAPGFKIDKKTGARVPKTNAQGEQYIDTIFSEFNG